MTNGSDFRQINIMLPFRAVVGLNDAARRKQRGFERVVAYRRQIAFNVCGARRNWL